MTTISLVMPYYKNPGMLKLQIHAWNKWPQHLKDHFEIVIVDDGSAVEKAADIAPPVDFARYAVYEVLEDRPWHQHGARNLGAHVARGEWLLLTDMDHQLERNAAEELLCRVVEKKVSPDTVYMFDRIEADTRRPTLDRRSEHKPHPNSWFMTRGAYWKIGGYDEDYCGLYGTDALFRRRCFAKFAKGHLHGIALVRYWRDIVSDASTRDLPRKEGRDPGATKRVAAEKAARGEADTIKTLAFPWRPVIGLVKSGGE